MNFFAAVPTNSNQNPTHVLTSNGVIPITNSVNNSQLQTGFNPSQRELNTDPIIENKYCDLSEPFEKELEAMINFKKDNNTDFQALFIKYKDYRKRMYQAYRAFYEENKASLPKWLTASREMQPPDNVADDFVTDLMYRGGVCDSD